MNWTSLTSNQKNGEYFKEPSENLARYYPRKDIEREYHYIINSPSFRRLQDKTQVFPLDTSDFVRTRLTHSIETSSIAKTIAEMIINFAHKQKGSKFEDIKAYIDIESKSDISNIMLCAGLIHDIGNPPFGHFGEVIIQDWFKEHLPRKKYGDTTIAEALGENSQQLLDLYHFEGNAQALRLLTKLHSQNDNDGLHLTYALLNTIIKYPTSSTELLEYNRTVASGEDKDIRYKKIGYFYSEKDVFTRITSETGANSHRHPLTFILEAADDIAYVTGDLEDAFKKGMFTYQQLIEAKHNYLENLDITSIDTQSKTRTEELFSILDDLKKHAQENNYIDPDMYAIRNWIPHVQFWFSYCSCYSFTNSYEKIMLGEHKSDLFNDAFHRYSINILKNVMQTYVYPSATIEKLEIAAHSIITGLLNKFVKAVLYYDSDYSKDSPYTMDGVDKKLVRLISDNYIDVYKRESKDKPDPERLYLRLLLVTDFICGMTDSYAKSLYQELEGMN